MRTQLLTICALAGLAISGCKTAQAPYDNEAADTAAVFFAPEILSKDKFEINALFNASGDELIYAQCKDDFSHCTLMASKFESGKWQPAEALPFSGDYLDADPYYSVDYQFMYYVSKRPLPGTKGETKNVNIWRVSRTNNGWGEPEYMALLNSPENDLYPTMTAKGDLYFPSFREGRREMYVAEAKGQGFSAPKPLPRHIYGDGAAIGDSVMLRDGKRIIFSMRRADSLGKGDLYVSDKVDGQWTVARHLGPLVNTEDHEFTPIVSDDGKYLFFTRIEDGKGNVYQISMKALGL